MDKSIKDNISSFEKIAKKFNLKLLILFGSRASKKFTKKSDYDFAFLSDKNISSKEEINIFNEIQKLIKNENIDLINISNNHDVKLRHEIFSKGSILFESRKFLFKELAGKIYIDYIDFQKFEKNRLKLLKKDIMKLEI